MTVMHSNNGCMRLCGNLSVEFGIVWDVDINFSGNIHCYYNN